MNQKIDIDQEVFQALEARVSRFGDSPNSVLRDLLGLNVKESISRRPPLQSSSLGAGRIISSREFVEKVLLHEFGRGFARRGRFTYLLENKDNLVYFQNFNKTHFKAWYRITSARRDLEDSKKKVFLCFTIPAENHYYLIPYTDVQKQVRRVNWTRPELEVNIDRVRSSWTGLKWDISEYKKTLPPA